MSEGRSPLTKDAVAKFEAKAILHDPTKNTHSRNTRPFGRKWLRALAHSIHQCGLLIRGWHQNGAFSRRQPEEGAGADQVGINETPGYPVVTTKRVIMDPQTHCFGVRPLRCIQIMDLWKRTF